MRPKKTSGYKQGSDKLIVDLLEELELNHCHDLRDVVTPLFGELWDEFWNEFFTRRDIIEWNALFKNDCALQIHRDYWLHLLTYAGGWFYTFFRKNGFGKMASLWEAHNFVTFLCNVFFHKSPHDWFLTLRLMPEFFLARVRYFLFLLDPEDPFVIL